MTSSQVVRNAYSGNDKTYLRSLGILSAAIAHMKAEAEFKPPPHMSKIEDSHTIFKEKIWGNAPEFYN